MPDTPNVFIDPTDDSNDVQGHVLARGAMEQNDGSAPDFAARQHEDDDVEGHLAVRSAAAQSDDEDDVEGHVRSR